MSYLLHELQVTGGHQRVDWVTRGVSGARIVVKSAPYPGFTGKSSLKSGQFLLNTATKRLIEAVSLHSAPLRSSINHTAAEHTPSTSAGHM